MDYSPREIEKKWKNYWEENSIYKVRNPEPGETEKPKFYILDMFPYPSGAGLHVGHPLGYIASDIFSRYKRLNGFNVLHPMGFDAFGLPAEEYALQTGIHPAESTHANMQRYREQLSDLGFSFDWSREVSTCDPKYYKWTQWIFTELFAHYYNNETNKAEPIQDLIDVFSKNGNAGVQAANAQEEIFSAEDWNAMTAKEKDDVLMNYRLAYRKVGYVNWCEELGTVLANDQVKDGVSERGGHPVIQKAMTQWYLRITAYAERLLTELEDIDWSEALKTIQRNWIGRSEGATVFFDVEGSDQKIEVFTTRPDTIFGATYMVLAPLHELVTELTTDGQREKVETYINYVSAKSEVERMAEKEVTGEFIGAYAINPFTNEKIQIWIGEYVLKDYGTGAIMAVPADDERDERFAQKFNLPIIPVIDKSAHPGASIEDKIGTMINSGFLNGMEVMDAIHAINVKIEEKGIGEVRVNYKIRDTNFSRQRYWGEPFPIIYDTDGVAHAVKKEDLPVELPMTDDFKPGRDGRSPLSRIPDWVNLPNGFTRETDTMPAVAGSSWYYLRYMDAINDKNFVSQDAVNYWKEVDLYVGGIEHAVAHLLYARFWHKFLYDLNLVPTPEPFRKLVNQGMIQGVIEFMYLQKDKVNGNSRFICAKLLQMEPEKREFVRIPVHIDFVVDYGSNDSYMNQQSIAQFIKWRPEYKDAIFECSKGVFHKGEFIPTNGATDSQLYTLSEVGKMSKSKFNVINPDEVVDRYGTDCFRMYEMFLGPIEQSKPWDTQGISGVSKFLRKFWDLFFDEQDNFNVSNEAPTKEELKVLHTAIKKVTEDIERFAFNTCVSAFMEAVNDLRKLNCNKKAILEPLTILLAPFAPHMAEEVWFRFGGFDHTRTVQEAAFPQYDESYLVEDSIKYPIAINGKTRAFANFPANASKGDLEKAAVGMEDVKKWTDGKTVRKVIVVPNRMINIVVN